MNNFFIALQILNVVLICSGFLGCSSSTSYFDVCIFNPLSDTNRSITLASCFQFHDREKQRTYEQRVCEVERAPPLFSALGGMSKPTEITYKRLALLLATSNIML